DDMKLNLMVASGMMKNYGMKIDTASSGKEAIEMVQKQDYDIVFMDHMMPEMDGVDTTRRIRELGGKYKDLVIIALTANVLGEAKELFSEEGMQDFLGKPISLKALNEIMDKWLPVKEEA
ncbi:MAG: response regulator, partial [Lachnospiraceae bacterium]